MLQIAQLDIYSARGQVIIMLLAMLIERGRGTRRDTCNAILDFGWFNLIGEDWPPYPTQPIDEARWRTVIAWARKDAYEDMLLSDAGRDNWQISTKGTREFTAIRGRFEDHTFDVKKCFMWKKPFKTYMDSTYSPSEHDSPRPTTIYQDELRWDRLSDAMRQRILDLL